MQEVKAIKTLLPLLRLYPWVIPLIIILGIFSSLFEGLGISLFILFLQNLDTTNSQRVSSNLLVNFLNQIFILL